MASGSDECQFPGCDSMTRGNGLPWLYSARRRVWPGAALPLCRLTSRGISSAARRARAKRGDPWPRPQRRWQACSRPLTIRTSVRASPWFGLRAVPLPSPGRTHLPVRLTVVDPRLLTRFCAEMASSAGMPARKSACPPGNKSRPSENDHIQHAAREIFRLICNQERIPLVFALIRGLGPAMLPVTRIVRC